MTHWTKMHVSITKLSKCSFCKTIIHAKHKAKHGRQNTAKIELTIMKVINKEYIDPESYVPRKLLKPNTEAQQKPVQSRGKLHKEKEN